MQYSLKSFLVGSVVLILLDALFLYANQRGFENAVIHIQKTNIQLRWISVAGCYLLLTTGLWYFILRRHRDPLEAFFLGLLVYGVYETSTYAVFRHWPPAFVAMDTLWGGVLFSLTTWITYMV